MPINPHNISLTTKSCNPIHRDDPNHYVSTIHIDILHGADQEKIGVATAYEVRMDQIINDDKWSLFNIFDGHSSELCNLYEELFADDELIPAVADELLGYENIVLIKSIILKPEYRRQGLGGILALAIAERFGESDIVALKPWPMNPDGPDNPAGVWELPRLTATAQKAIARKLGKSYMTAGFKPLFKGSAHLFLTHYRHPSASQLATNCHQKQTIRMDTSGDRLDGICLAGRVWGFP